MVLRFGLGALTQARALNRKVILWFLSGFLTVFFLLARFQTGGGCVKSTSGDNKFLPYGVGPFLFGSFEWHCETGADGKVT